MTQAERILSKFKGVSTQDELAKGCKVTQGAIAMWKKRGRIPGHKQDAVLSFAQTVGVALAPADFFEVAAE